MSIPPEYIWAKMKAREAKEARIAPATANNKAGLPRAPKAVRKSSASVYSEDTTYSYDKDFLEKPASEKRSLGTKIKGILK